MSSAYIDPRDGLLAQTLTRAVEDLGPLATGDGMIYHYTTGVWRPDGERIIRNRTAGLLGEQYRPAHASTVVDILGNRDPWLHSESLDTRFLNLPNGLLDWKTGTFHDHTPKVRSTIRLPVNWDPYAECPEILKWMGQVFPEDSREFIEEVIGYALYNGNPLHKAIMAFGRGRNGKGTFLRLLTALIGKENISSVSPQALDENRFMGAELYGKLANFAGDVDPRTFKATEMFKKMTGEDLITVERKHGQPFQYVSRAVMIAAFNRLPRTADTTEGFFSRWIIVPFTGYFPAGVADPKLMEKLTAPGELQGLLVLAVAGLRRLMARGKFELPEAVEQATGAFRRDADPIRAFLHEKTEGDYDGWMPRGDLLAGYQRWAETNGYKPMGAATFYERVAESGEDVYGYPLTAKGRKGVRGFGGLAWRRDDGESNEQDEKRTGEHNSGSGGAEVAAVAEVAGNTLFPPYARGQNMAGATRATRATAGAPSGGLRMITCPHCAASVRSAVDPGETAYCRSCEAEYIAEAA